MTDQQRLLTTSDVAIKQVAIEVKVLKIGNRQVTLAVFRQLPNEQIINFETGELKGIPWGRVNYHVDCKGNDHTHLVWQKGNELRRAVIHDELRFSFAHRLRVDIDFYGTAFVAARILEGWMPETESRTIFGDSFPALPNPFRFEFCKEPIAVYLPDTVSRAWKLVYEDNDREKKKVVVEDIKNLQSLCAIDGKQQDSNSLADLLRLAVTKRNQCLQDYDQSYSQLEQLDQLYIAV